MDDVTIVFFLMSSAQKRLAIRMVRAYCTISFEAAYCVAGTIPWSLLARMYASTTLQKVDATPG